MKRSDWKQVNRQQEAKRDAGINTNPPKSHFRRTCPLCNEQVDSPTPYINANHLSGCPGIRSHSDPAAAPDTTADMTSHTETAIPWTPETGRRWAELIEQMGVPITMTITYEPYSPHTDTEAV